ncbi:MAG: hypothetical protein ACI9LM_000118 [Alteromonadaceae bacterium]|jgi:hypothetical protein
MLSSSERNAMRTVFSYIELAKANGYGEPYYGFWLGHAVASINNDYIFGCEMYQLMERFYELSAGLVSPKRPLSILLMAEQRVAS